MAILSDESYPTPFAGASDLLHLDDYFCPLPFARMINNRWTRSPTGGTATVGITRQRTPPPTQSRPEEQGSSRRNDGQGCYLLPIHEAKIALVSDFANGQLMRVLR